MACTTCIGCSRSADFGEALVVISPSPRSNKMSEPTKFRKRPPPPAQTPRQKTIAFESGLTRGLTGLERMRVVKQLAQLLMLAAGIASKESDVER
jgi:hypothetical protein